MSSPRVIARRLLALLGAVLLAIVPSAVVAPSASAAEPGYVRLAHFSPDTPAVDVWLTSFSGAARSVVLRGVSYGNVSDYQRVTPGVYTVAMRAPGSAADSPPLLRTNVTVKSGRAYTVAGVGPNSGVQLRVLTDDLSSPPAGQGRIRVVQASATAPVVDVVAQPGDAVIARGASFPSTTAYSEVKAQQWKVQVQPRGAGTPGVAKDVAVAAGSVYSFVVLDDKQGGLRVETLQDAGGPSTMPVGSVATGGGTADVTGPAPLVVVGLLGLLAAVAAAVMGGGQLLGRRRSGSQA